MAEVEVRASKYPGTQESFYDIADAENLCFVGAAYSTPSAIWVDGVTTGLRPERLTTTLRRGANPPEGPSAPDYKFSVGGHVVKKDGSPGKRLGAFYFHPGNDGLAPDWAREVLHVGATFPVDVWRLVGEARARRTKTRVQELFVVTNAAAVRDARDGTAVRPHRVSIAVWSNGNVQVGVEGPKLKADGTSGQLKGHVVPAPSDYPAWLGRLVAQQRALIAPD